MILADRISEWLKGHRDAIEFVLTAHEIAELWDDLIDRDKPVEDISINVAFYKALVALPRNRFYQENFTLLNPVLESSILDWLTANQFEKSKEAEKLRHAWGLRFSPFALTVMSARIIGGFEWAQKVNAEFRALGEPWERYAKEHGVV